MTGHVRAPELLATALASLALLGIWHPVTRSVLPLTALLLLTLGSVLLGVGAVRRAREVIRIEPDAGPSAAAGWTVTHRTGVITGRTLRNTDCVLMRGGYRSESLLVLSLRTRQGRRMRIDIWRNAVSPQLFSALHLALAYDTADDARRGAPAHTVHGAGIAAAGDRAAATSPKIGRHAALHSLAVDGARRTKETDHS